MSTLTNNHDPHCRGRCGRRARGPASPRASACRVTASRSRTPPRASASPSSRTSTSTGPCRRSATAHEAGRSWARTTPRQARGRAARMARAARRAHRGPGPPHQPRDGQAAGRGARRGRVRKPTSCAGTPRRRCAPPATSAKHPTAARHPHPPRARRARGADHAVELPARDGHPQDRARARRRLHGGDQARRADPADHDLRVASSSTRRVCPTAWSTS